MTMMRIAGRRKLRRLLHALLWPSGSVRHWGWQLPGVA
jgi:hypothetical protein